VIAHVMEMQGRVREGLEFLTATESAWMDTTTISVHLAWHRALFHLDADDPASALAVYDAQIANMQEPDLSELADASALLWRLHLRNIRVDDRWRSLADRWEMQTLTDVRPFYIIHAMMAFAASGRKAAAQRMLSRLSQVETRGASLSYAENALMEPLCKALLAFSYGDYAACVELLVRVRHVHIVVVVASPSVISFTSQLLRRHCARAMEISPGHWSQSAQHRSRPADSISNFSDA
ncbi:MAG: hypothetical protein WCD65_22565, partial [Pseudolabrys sp.]